MASTQASAGTRAGLALLVGGVVAVGASYTGTIAARSAPPWAPWALAIGASAASTALFVLGAASRRVLSRGIAVLLASLFLTLVVAFGAALALAPGEGPDARLVFGLPLRLAVVFYGVGFAPLLVLPVAFGVTFDRNASPPPAATSAAAGRASHS